MYHLSNPILILITGSLYSWSAQVSIEPVSSFAIHSQAEGTQLSSRFFSHPELAGRLGVPKISLTRRRPFSAALRTLSLVNEYGQAVRHSTTLSESPTR